MLIPVVTVGALFATRYFAGKANWGKAWVSSAVTIVGGHLLRCGGALSQPAAVQHQPTYSLTIYNSSSSPLTLKIMLTVALIFVPIVIAYQAWTYRLFHPKVTQEDLAYEEAY